jgi:hypothetical protein
MSRIAWSIAQKRVDVFTEIVDEVIHEHEAANLARDMEDLVREMMATVELLKCQAGEYSSGLRHNTAKKDIVQVHLIRSLIGQMIESIAKVQEMIADFGEIGHSIEGEADFKLCKHDLEKLLAELAKNWLLSDKDRVEQSKRQLAAGDFKSV